jgi:hypothetical protein
VVLNLPNFEMSGIEKSALTRVGQRGKNTKMTSYQIKCESPHSALLYPRAASDRELPFVSALICNVLLLVIQVGET